MIDIFIPGIAAPQGSKKHVGRGVLVESSARVRPWRESIRHALIDELPDGWTPIEQPVAVTLLFHFPRPKSHYRTGRYAHMLKPSAPQYHTTTPDLDKLQRAVLDAITSAGYWRDDSQATWLDAAKVYGERPGLSLRLIPHVAEVA